MIMADLMNVLVTGSTGFIGSRLVNDLVKKNHEVSCLVHSDKPVHPQTKVIRDDLTKSNLVFSENFDVVYHLAAAWPGEKDKKLQRVNYDGSVNLFNAIQNRTKSLVYISGLGVFGDSKEKIIDERSPFNPNTKYAMMRLKSQKFLEDNCKKHGISFTVAYLGDVYGNGGWFTSMMLERLRKGSFRIPGSGLYYRSFVHVDDVSSSLISIIEKNAVDQSFVITDSNPVKFSEFVSYVSSKIGVKMPKTIPAFLAKAILGSDFVSLLTTSIKTSNSKISKIYNFRYPSFQNGVGSVLEELKF